MWGTSIMPLGRVAFLGAPAGVERPNDERAVEQGCHDQGPLRAEQAVGPTRCGGSRLGGIGLGRGRHVGMGACLISDAPVGRPHLVAATSAAAPSFDGSFCCVCCCC